MAKLVLREASRAGLLAVVLATGFGVCVGSDGAHASPACRQKIDRAFEPKSVKGVNADLVELFANPETGGSLGEVSKASIMQARVLCEAPNLMLLVQLPDNKSGWVFGDDIEIDRNYNLSSGCSKSEETRVGATRGSGDCGG